MSWVIISVSCLERDRLLLGVNSFEMRQEGADFISFPITPLKWFVHGGVQGGLWLCRSLMMMMRTAVGGWGVLHVKENESRLCPGLDL